MAVNSLNAPVSACIPFRCMSSNKDINKASVESVHRIVYKLVKTDPLTGLTFGGYPSQRTKSKSIDVKSFSKAKAITFNE